IPLHPVVLAELRKLKERRAAEYGGEVAPSEPLLLSRRGKPWNDFRGAWNGALERAGLAGRKGLCFHALRHSFATHYLGHGGTIPDLMGLLGHRQLSTTMIYAHLVDARTKAGVEALDFDRAR
ncbi:MAG: tyrosine-type recombinase/integrase, partial [Planctomycetaceae bacterium]